MKEFANKISVKCDIGSADHMRNLLSNVGYKSKSGHNYNEWCITNLDYDGMFSFHLVNGYGMNNMYIIDHYNEPLIRDIVSVCSNETWQKDEPTVYHFRGDFIYSGPDGDNSLCNVRNHPFHSYRRPTVAEICNHYGYHLEGNNIVKNIEKPTLEERVAKLEEAVCNNTIKISDNYGEHKVVLITNDGHEMMVGDSYYKVCYDYDILRHTLEDFTPPTPIDNQIVIARFKHKEAAEAYVLKNKPFEPVDVVITCNSPEELRGLWHVFNQTDEAVEKLIKTDRNIGKYKLDTLGWFKVVRSVLGKLNMEK